MSPPPSPQPPPLKTTTESAIRIWRASVDPRGTAVERYLTSRGLALDDDVAGSVIRWNRRRNGATTGGRRPRWSV